MKKRLVFVALVVGCLLVSSGCATNKKSLMDYDYPLTPEGYYAPYPGGPVYMPGMIGPYPPYFYGYPYLYP